MTNPEIEKRARDTANAIDRRMESVEGLSDSDMRDIIAGHFADMVPKSEKLDVVIELMESVNDIAKLRAENERLQALLTNMRFRVEMLLENANGRKPAWPLQRDSLGSIIGVIDDVIKVGDNVTN